MKSKLSIIILLIFLISSCKNNKNLDTSNLEIDEAIAIKQKEIKSFLADYPKFKKYKKQLIELYKSQNSESIWFNENEEIQELASVLHYNLHNISTEGLDEEVPYLEKFDSIFKTEIENEKSLKNNDILISSLYLYYNDKVVEGTDYNSRKLGWFISKKKVDYIHLIDSIKANPEADIKKITFIDQYYKLHEKLLFYNEIEKKGGWEKIAYSKKDFPINLDDNSTVISAVKKRLIREGYLNHDDSSNVFNVSLKVALKEYQETNSLTINDTIITSELLENLNKPVEEKITTLKLNMERCRWMDPKLFNSNELIFVNIPAFQLNYFKNDILAFNTKVVVGKNASKTVIFDNQLSYIVFAPYWNVPKSIINDEIIPGIEKDENYLEKHKMEWNDGNVRQLPGPWNSLGLIKFIFPNSNNIYLHDTPSKNLFNQDVRAFSHGCIRVENPDILAEKILTNDPKWTKETIHKAMNGKTETTYELETKIPVVISYFTAWVNEKGQLIFYDDIYKRDKRLAKIIL